ncbi:MAG: tautomerase family protein [SAR324 cluster bacterium]|nr:tautomerase family protein [SAR324 cluster bacterium]
MPVVTIKQSKGISIDQKRQLTKRFSEALEEVYNVKPEKVTIFFQEFEDEYWGKDAMLNLDRKKKK